MGLTLDISEIIRKLAEGGKVQMMIGNDILVTANWQGLGVSAVPSLQISILGLDPNRETEGPSPEEKLA